MTDDPTYSSVRRAMVVTGLAERRLLQIRDEGGQVWDTEAFKQDFEAQTFLAPFVLVKRKSDGVFGALLFTHQPRFYFDFSPDPPE